MNRREHLFQCLQEECNEIAQQSSKINRFGLMNIQPASGKFNLELLINEVTDFYAVLEMLEEDGVPILDHINHRDAIEEKKKKVEKHIKIAKAAGTVV